MFPNQPLNLKIKPHHKNSTLKKIKPAIFKLYFGAPGSSYRQSPKNNSERKKLPCLTLADNTLPKIEFFKISQREGSPLSLGSLKIPTNFSVPTLNVKKHPLSTTQIKLCQKILFFKSFTY